MFCSHISFLRKEDQLTPKDSYPSLEAHREISFSLDEDDVLSSTSEELVGGPTDMPPQVGRKLIHLWLIQSCLM